MTPGDLTSVPTVELLTRAADAAGKLANAVPTQGPWCVVDFGNNQRCVKAEDGTLVETVYTGAAIATLVAASGPDHWRAVEALLRGMLAEHDRYWRQHQEPEHHCRHGYIACHLVQAARPLAEQVLQHLGDTE